MALAAKWNQRHSGSAKAPQNLSPISSRRGPQTLGGPLGALGVADAGQMRLLALGALRERKETAAAAAAAARDMEAAASIPV